MKKYGGGGALKAKHNVFVGEWGGGGWWGCFFNPLGSWLL